MGKKLFVGNLSWSLTDEQLKEVFSKIGAVEEAVIIMDRARGRSKGFGFVTFSAEEDAQKAIEELNGKEVEGRTMNVSFAISKEKPEDNKAE